jgi:hypothetical protein
MTKRCVFVRGVAPSARMERIAHEYTALKLTRNALHIEKLEAGT